MKKALGPVTFIGAGNLTWHLAPALDNTDFSVREVYSRDHKKARQIVGRLYQAEAKKTLDFSTSTSRIFILAVSDDAIESLAGRIALPEDSILAHTSGTTPLSALDHACTKNTGVFYPLQTFSQNRKINVAETPFFIEGRNAQVDYVLGRMGRAIGDSVFNLPSDKRMALHLSAVFASNFSNHMVSIAFDLMEHHDLKVHWLEPLIVETLNKSLETGPQAAQTGPARRGDLEILRKHAEFLKKDRKLREIYRVISQHILDKYRS